MNGRTKAIAEDAKPKLSQQYGFDESAETDDSQGTYDWPDLGQGFIDHEPSQLRLAYQSYEALLAELRPVSSSSAQHICSGKNPLHSTYTNGVLKRDLDQLLSYRSDQAADSGLGPGIQLSHLTVAFLVSDDFGQRVVVNSGGQVSTMLPIGDYSGPVAAWPEATSRRAKADNNLIIVQDDAHHWQVFQRASEDVYFLVASKRPNSFFRYIYSDDGLSEILPENECDEGIKFYYSSGRLNSVQLAGPIATVEKGLFYNAEGQLQTVTTNLPNTPRTLDIDTSTEIRLLWNSTGKLEGIDINGNLSERFAYKDFRVSQIIDSDKTKALTYGEGFTLVQDTSMLLDSIVYHDQCQITATGIEGLPIGITSYEVVASGLRGLALGRVVKATSADGTSIGYEYSSDGFLKKTLTTNAAGQLFSTESRKYDDQGFLLSVEVKSLRSEKRLVRTYNAGKRISSETGPNLSLSYSYDEQGNVVKVTTPLKRQKFAFDSRGLMVKSFNSSINQQLAYSYNSQCKIETLDDGATVTDYTYLIDGRVSRIAKTGFVNVTQNIEYDDVEGRRIVTTHQGTNTVSQVYNFIGQLESSSVNGQAVVKKGE